MRTYYSASAAAFTLLAFFKRVAVASATYASIVNTKGSSEYGYGAELKYVYASNALSISVYGSDKETQFTADTDSCALNEPMVAVATCAGVGGNVALYKNGVQVVAPSVTPYYTQGPQKMVRICADPGAYGVPQENYLTALFGRVLSDEEIRDISANPWQLFKDTSPRSIIILGSGGNSHNLTADAVSQANTSGTGAIGQEHAVVGASSAQANTSGTGAISQEHNMPAVSVSQDNVSGTGAITQDHVIVGASSTQANASSSGAISQTVVYDLTADAVSQDNVSGAGAISQEHNLTADAVSQANTSGTGAIGQEHNLIGAACVQTTWSSTGSIGGEEDSVFPVYPKQLNVMSRLGANNGQ